MFKLKILTKIILIKIILKFIIKIIKNYIIICKKLIIWKIIYIIFYFFNLKLHF